jgi:AmmeMemoRadiSam system protein B
MPAVAGRFYPGRADALRQQVKSYVVAAPQRVRALACIVPHAGIMYSGHVAGAVYGRVQIPERIILLGPNHTGRGQRLAIMSEGAWRTPLGDVPIDAQLAAELREALAEFKEDDVAHALEHALEVQLPFLQAEKQDFRFVPICVGTSDLDDLTALGEALAKVVQASNDAVLLISSSDMNHYETDAATRIKDAKAMERILALDPAGLYEVVHREQISMCGYAPTVAVLTACVSLGAAAAELVKYATSADISGDRSFCVGYAGFLIRK